MSKTPTFQFTIRCALKQAEKFRMLSAKTRVDYADLFQDIVDFIDARAKDPNAKEPIWLRVLREEESEKKKK